MDHERLRTHRDEIVAELAAKAVDGVVTTKQIVEVIGELDITDDLERLAEELDRRGIAWRDPGVGEPPVFPPGYAGLTGIKGGRA